MSKADRLNQYAVHCPTCGREFNDVNDYPRVRVLAFERLPIPEAVDEMSEAAAERWLARRRNEPNGGDLRHDRGINMTPAIAEACSRPDVQAYFEQGEQLVNQEVEPGRLRPSWSAYRVFRRAHRIGDTGLCLSLHEAEPAQNGERLCQLLVCCDGPNMGSAGGTTLQELGPIAKIHYRGILTGESRPVGP
jgi:hypothetical protein